MIVIPYLVLAAIRLALSPVKPENRPRLFFYRFLVAVFAVVLAIPAEAIMIQYRGQQDFGALIAVLIVIFVGEHLIYLDLYRREMLPDGAPRLPLGY